MEFTSFGTQMEVDRAFPDNGRNMTPCACLGLEGAAGDKKGVNFCSSEAEIFSPVNVSAGLPYPNDVVFVS